MCDGGRIACNLSCNPTATMILAQSCVFANRRRHKQKTLGQFSQIVYDLVRQAKREHTMIVLYQSAKLISALPCTLLYDIYHTELSKVIASIWSLTRMSNENA